MIEMLQTGTTAVRRSHLARPWQALRLKWRGSDLSLLQFPVRSATMLAITVLAPSLAVHLPDCDLRVLLWPGLRHACGDTIGLLGTGAA